MPVVSVIVPVYNAEKYLDKCIQSILKQTYSSFELLLIDDGSPDSSGIICDQYAEKDQRILVFHKINEGVSSARNYGIDKAAGSFLLFVDADDYIEPQYIEKMIDSRYDLVISGTTILDERGNVLSVNRCQRENFKKPDIDFAYLYEKLILYSPYGKSFRADIVKNNKIRFPESITWGEDGMFVADYISCIQSLSIIDYVGYNYIKYDRNQSLSTRIRPEIIDMICKSRKHCINCIKSIEPEQFDSVKRVIEEDIRSNCAYFVTQVITGTAKSEERIAVLEGFLHNSFVRETVDNAEKYYRDEVIVRSLRKKNAAAIVKSYPIIRQIDDIRQWLHANVFIHMPSNIRKQIQKFRRTQKL